MFFSYQILLLNECHYFQNSKYTFSSFLDRSGERGGSVVECRTPERRSGVRNQPLPCCVLEQDTLLPESNG